MMSQKNGGHRRAISLGEISTRYIGRRTVIVAISCIAIASVFLGLAAVPFAIKEPWQIRLVLAATAIVPFALIFLFDQADKTAAALSIVASILGTFLGASIAFMQSDFQAKQSDKDTLIRQIDRALMTISLMHETWKNARGDVKKFFFRESDYSLVAALLVSDKLPEFIGNITLYDMDYAYEAITVMSREALHPEHQKADVALGNVGIAQRALYGDLCTIRAFLAGEYDTAQLGRGGPRFFTNGTSEIWAKAPKVCQSVLPYSTIFKDLQ
jgi:hypothetical protein